MSSSGGGNRFVVWIGGGRRPLFTVGGTTTNLTFFGDGQDDLYSDATSTHRNTILGLTQIGSDLYTRDNAGGLVAQNTSNGQQYLHLDALGSVRAITGPTGTVAKRFDYDPYGRAISTDVPGP